METKKQLLEKAKEIAQKHSDLKITIEKMLDDLDNLEIEYNEIIKKIKNN
jgi:hypothetical protein